MEIEAVGGYEGVGRNMTLVRIGNSQLAIDCGIKLDSYLLYYGKDERDFEEIPTEDLLRVGAIPDPHTRSPIDAFLISHGHLDHIGALSRFLDKHKAPVFATAYSSGLISQKLTKEQLGRIFEIDYKHEIPITPSLSAEFVQVTHSIPQSSIIDIHSKEGDLVYAADFKFDDDSKIAKTDYKRLKEIGRQGVKALVVESLDVGKEGKSYSEKVARAKIRDVMSFAHENGKLIMATTFSTHLERIQTLITEADKLGRKIIIAGSSYMPNCSMGVNMGLLDLPEASIVAGKKLDRVFSKIEKGGRENYFLLVTGHQGEPGSILSRIADNQFHFHLTTEDFIIFSSSTIPTDVNIANKSQMIDKLKNHGVRILDDVHVSGHANKEEHRKLIKMLNPEHIIPCHGDARMLASYLELAEEEGYRVSDTVHLLRNGSIVEL